MFVSIRLFKYDPPPVHYTKFTREEERKGIVSELGMHFLLQRKLGTPGI